MNDITEIAGAVDSAKPGAARSPKYITAEEARRNARKTHRVNHLQITANNTTEGLEEIFDAILKASIVGFHELNVDGAYVENGEVYTYMNELRNAGYHVKPGAYSTPENPQLHIRIDW